MESQLLSEIEEGNYIKMASRPTIISALGAIPKPNSSDIRLIHDCSQPVGGAVNDYATNDHFRYQTIDDATQMITKDCYLAKVDLKSAYRSVKIHPSNYQATGLQWKFAGDTKPTYLSDTRLPFGAKLAPSIFHRLTQSVRRMMARRGYDTMVVYLDDFLIIAPDFDSCVQALNILLRLLRRLGFRIAWKKVEGPTQRLTFLGIEINTNDLTLRLPLQKLNELLDLLLSFSAKKRASRRQLESLAGKLAWACRVIKGGRTFLRRILDQLHKLRCPSHKILLSQDFKKDIQWWLTCLPLFNGAIKFVDPRPITDVHIDASNLASGIFHRGDWQYTLWSCDWPTASSLHINHKEVLSVILAARRWGTVWRNSTVHIFTDSTVAMACINHGTSRNPIVMTALRELFWLSVYYNFNMHAIHVPGKDNCVPDAISRLHQSGQARRLYTLLYKDTSLQFCSADGFFSSFHNHMSDTAASILLPQILRLKV